MLAGFFTYKAGVLGRATVALVREMRGDHNTQSPGQVLREGDAPGVPNADETLHRGAQAPDANAADRRHEHDSQPASSSAEAAPVPAAALGHKLGAPQAPRVALPRAPAGPGAGVGALAERQMRSS